MTVTAALFDLDGTLTKFNLDYGSAADQIRDELNKFGINGYSSEQIYSLNKILNDVQGWLSEDNFTLFLRRIHSIMQKYEIVSAKETHLLPYAHETLEYLKHNNMKIGIVTNNGRTASRIVAERFSLLNIIDVIITREDAERWKPDGATLREALSRLKVSSREAIFVGDSIIDVLAAHDSNVTSVAIPTGPTTLKNLLNVEPDYLLYSLKEFPNLLNIINSGEIERKIIKVEK